MRVFNVAHFVVKLEAVLGLRNFAYNLQPYTSALCSARLHAFSRLSAFSLAVLRLKCFAPDLGLFYKLCLALEGFVQNSGGELM